MAPGQGALLCDDVQPPQEVVQTRPEHFLQQYSAHLAKSAAFGVMLHIYRDVNSHFSSIRNGDYAGGPQSYHIFTSLVRHD